MKKTLWVCFIAAVCASGMNAGAGNIAVLVEGGLFLMGEDPINIPEDKEFLLETIAVEEPGIYWLILHLENDLGHTANIYNSDDDDPGVVEEANDLIFVTESLGSSAIAGDYSVTNKPFISTEFYVLDDMGFASTAAFTGGASNEGSIVKIVNPDHPIAQGLPEEFSITVDDPDTGEPAIVTFGAVTDPSVLSAGEVIAVLPTSINESDTGAELPADVPILIVAEAGSDVGNDTRWVFLGYSDVEPLPEYGGKELTRTMALLNENGIKLLDNVIAWALGEEPVDVANWAIH